MLTILLLAASSYVTGNESSQGDLSELRDAISSPMLRIYSTDDLTGAVLGSCLKNVYAIATGISDGLGFGDNKSRSSN